MKHSVLISILTLVLLACVPHRINSVDKRGKRHGHWLSYYDSAQTKVWTNIAFRHGKNRGYSYYYYASGLIERKEFYKRNKRLNVWLYYPNGQLKTKGKAIQEETKEKIHFYFTGVWPLFSDSGQLMRIQHYEKGQIKKIDYISHQHNDSLKRFLEFIDRQFQETNQRLTDSINKANNPIQKKYFRQLKKEADSLIFSLVLNHILYNGYPSKKEVDEAANIPFFILSFAPVIYRHVALPIFEEAARKKDIELKSLAFFIDKLRMANQQKQLYGTQYYLEGDSIKYYPVEKPNELLERRRNMGLE